MIEEYQVAKPNRILVNQYVVNEYKLRLARRISDNIDDFEEEFQLFSSAGRNDIINIDLITPGGSFDTGHMLCRAIKSCEARTKVYIGPTCASMGTAIALACDEWEVDELSSFMIHTVSYGHGGFAPHVKANVDHNDKVIERFVRNTYTGFLTEEEIERVLDGREMYFDGEELANRLTSYSQYRQQMIEESQEILDGEKE